MTTLSAGRIVVDASFILGIADQEPTASRFLSVIQRRAVITSINFGEVLYKLAQGGRPAFQTEQIFTGLGLNVDDVSLADVRTFPDLKSIDATSRASQLAANIPVADVKRLSLADMTCLGYAQHRNLPVLTGDKHWLTLNVHGLQPAVHDFRDPALSL